MEKAIILVLLAAGGLFSCSKIVKLNQPSVSGDELIARYKTLARVQVSAGFSALSSQGSFRGQMYLEPGSSIKALVFGYSPLGQSLFELKLIDQDFLLLDFMNSCAYSNQKSWLPNYTAGSSPDQQDQIAIALTQVFSALAGKIPEQMVFSRSANGKLEAAGPGRAKYFFNPADGGLEKMALEENGRELSFQFGYGSECWFPDQINLKGDGLRVSFKLEDIFCPESKRPQLEFGVPEGFTQILFSGR
jgi:hypothetical protein